jgi:hypothetical protein
VAAAYVSHDTGAASRSVTVPAGTDRLLVAIALSNASTGARTATYGGVSMSVASSANGWVQIFYMLAPTAGSATLAVSGANISTVVAAHYTGIGSFQSGQQATGSASANFSPNMAGLIAFGMVAGSSPSTPVASTAERYDSGGDWYGDRLVTGSGTVSVGVSSTTDPDYAGAIWLESRNLTGAATTNGTSSSGTITTPGFVGAVTTNGTTASGTVTVTVAATGAASKSLASTSGTAAVLVALSGSPSSSAATASGTAGVVVSLTGAATTNGATASGVLVRIPPVGGTIRLSSTLVQRVTSSRALRERVTSSHAL